jgi:hypothetical protein
MKWREGRRRVTERGAPYKAWSQMIKLRGKITKTEINKENEGEIDHIYQRKNTKKEDNLCCVLESRKLRLGSRMGRRARRSKRS